MKQQRHRKILELITNETIETQEQLTSRLRELGLPATQATISRDIHELHLHKALNSQTGTTHYVAPNAGESIASRLRGIFRDSVLSCHCAQNLVVIKTMAGLAGAAATAIDASHQRDILGTLAGDDTVFVAMRNTTAAKLYTEEVIASLQ